MKLKNKNTKLRNTQIENNSADTKADLALIDKILKSSRSDPKFDWNKSAKYRTLKQPNPTSMLKLFSN